MCTAITYRTKDHYFGRTLDLEVTYHETVTVMPRNYSLPFRARADLPSHYAMIGMATVSEDYPLYYEAANECGLAMAGLHFPGNAFYAPLTEGKESVASFEFIPWILSQCKNLSDARRRLESVNLCAIPFSEKFPLTPLHWLIADREGAITVESTVGGLKIYENPMGVLTNNPPFDYQMTHLSDYAQLSPYEPEHRFGGERLLPYSRGMGAMGLPGDFSSASRFVRAAFVKLNSVAGEGESESVGQFFHILDVVEQPRGCVRLPDNASVITQYTSCINLDRSIYYYTTYENRCISAVHLHRCRLDGTTLSTFPLQKEQAIDWQN